MYKRPIVAGLTGNYTAFFYKKMAGFLEQREKCAKVRPEVIAAELFEFIRGVKEYLIDLNKKQIREDSQDIYGKAIGFYSKATEEISDGKKKWGEPFTGDDTGSWLDHFYMAVVNDVFYFGSTDPKTDDILTSPDWLSHDLFGLTEEHLNMAIEQKFLPFILDYNRKALDL